MGDKVGENPAALRAAVFLLSSKNLRGGGAFKRPPPAGRGLIEQAARYGHNVIKYVPVKPNKQMNGRMFNGKVDLFSGTLN